MTTSSPTATAPAPARAHFPVRAQSQNWGDCACARNPDALIMVVVTSLVGLAIHFPICGEAARTAGTGAWLARPAAAAGAMSER